ncbi:MAG: serpin family protein [Prevotella sp.]|nr:serpin family protein [Prevotella sp.]
MKTTSKLLGLAIVLSCGLMSCSSSEEVSDDLGETKQVVNMLSEPVTIELTTEQKQFAYDNNGFTLKFLKAVNDVDKSGKSFIYSPLSITYVLGMVNDAATGQTEQELEQTLGFHKGGIQAVNEYCKKLIEGLPKVDDKVTLTIANAIFLNKKYTLKPQFQQDMQTYYGALAESLDFSAPQTLDHINGWCNEKTSGMIPSILDDVDPEMLSYLLNAIYFKADWASKFDQKNTRTETFTTTGGKKQLPLMHQNVLISYLKSDTYSAVIMPYGTGLWNMTVLLPEDGKTVDDVISEVTESYLLNNHGWCETGGNTFQPYEVDLKLPRFETDSDTDQLDTEKGLIGLMKKMGIKLAFDEIYAEIPNMSFQPVYIDIMRQKAKIKVNEEGSEAAAVTIGGAMPNSVGAQPVEYPKATFHANRPFAYVISEQSSGVILFVGKFTGD